MPQFAFIHTEDPTDAAGTKQNIARVRSHVTKRAHTARKASNAQRALPSTLLPRPLLATASSRAATKNKRSPPERKKGEDEEALRPNGALPAPPAPVRHPSATPRDQRVRRAMGLVHSPATQLMALNLMPHCGVRFWGKHTTAREAWHSTVPIDEDHPLIVSTRLHQASSISDILFNNRRPSLDTLEFQKEAIQSIQAGVNEVGSFISNELIFTILHTAIVAASQADTKAMFFHMDAAVRCIQLRGGLDQFPLVLRRMFIWYLDALRRVAVFFQPTRNYFEWSWASAVDNECEELPPDLVVEAFLREETTIRNLPHTIRLPGSTVLLMHILGLASSLEWARYSRHPSLSNSYFYLIHHMRRLKDRLENPNQRLSPDEDTIHIMRALVIGADLFIRATFAPITSDPFGDGYAIRTRNVIDTGDGLSLWERNNALNLYLWILCVALCSFNPRSVVRGWYLSTVREIVTKLDVRDDIEFQDAVMIFPWTTNFGPGVLKKLWKEVDLTEPAPATKTKSTRHESP